MGLETPAKKPCPFLFGHCPCRLYGWDIAIIRYFCLQIQGRHFTLTFCIFYLELFLLNLLKLFQPHSGRYAKRFAVLKDSSGVQVSSSLLVVRSLSKRRPGQGFGTPACNCGTLWWDGISCILCRNVGHACVQVQPDPLEPVRTLYFGRAVKWGIQKSFRICQSLACVRTLNVPITLQMVTPK